MTQPRLRRALDAGRLVPAERDAVTGRLTDHARERKRQRPRSQSVRHLLRTPAGVAGAVVVVGAVVVGTILTTAGGGSSTDPAKAAAERRAQQPVPPVGTTLPSLPAPSPAQLPGTQIDPCDVLTEEQALRTLGEPVRRSDDDPDGTCTWFARDTSRGTSWASFHWSTRSLAEIRQDAADKGLRITEHPELGAGGFSYPPLVEPLASGGTTFTGAAAAAMLLDKAVSVDVGHSTKDSHAADPEGDERDAVALMQRLLAEAGGGPVAGVG